MGEVIPLPDEFEAVDDMIPEGGLAIAYVRAALVIDAEGNRIIATDWNTDLEEFEFYGLMGSATEIYQGARADNEEE